jgi:hypothetical protein
VGYEPERETNSLSTGVVWTDSQAVASCEYMKREIKFRYWNGVTNQMVNEPEMPFKEGWTITQLFSERGWHWLQFTGLTDSNGRDIYEGDILELYIESKGNWRDKLYRVAVEWDQEMCCYRNSATHNEWDCEDAAKHEVIGNIYENPELMN